jgi:hypothetical protein
MSFCRSLVLILDLTSQMRDSDPQRSRESHSYVNRHELLVTLIVDDESSQADIVSSTSALAGSGFHLAEQVSISRESHTEIVEN